MITDMTAIGETGDHVAIRKSEKLYIREEAVHLSDSFSFFVTLELKWWRMKDWNSQIISTINEKLKDTRQSDLRFFRVEEFKRNVERTGTFSGKCPVCTRQKIIINEIVANIDQAIGTPGKLRRDYDRLINKLASHMQKEHGFYTPFHYTYRHSFYGIVLGTITGFLLMMLFSQYNWAYLSGGFSLGLLVGYIRGNQKDRKIREKKMLM